MTETAPPDASDPPLRIVYLAWLRERAGRAAEEVAPPRAVDTVAALVAWLVARGGSEASAFAAPSAVRAAVNHAFATPSTPVAPGDEIAFFPPVTGG